MNKFIISKLAHSTSTSIRASYRAFGAASSNNSVHKLMPKIRQFVEENAKICQPDNIHVCDGSEQENAALVNQLLNVGMLKKLPKYENCYIARTDPADVARVESKTYICTSDKRETVPILKDGIGQQLGNWMGIPEMETELGKRFPGCMKGRTMYVIPFSMGPVGSPLSKIGIQLTDSAYVVASMRIMTRMGQNVLEQLGQDDFVKCLHSVGQPLPLKSPSKYTWPCNPAATIVSHFPDRNMIASFGSGYGGNSLLGKKCFALRIASSIAKREGWLAEHMLILGITNPQGVKKYIAAAFPSACGKTNLAMMLPSLPGWKIECVGDDIAWMKFDSEGRLRAINPEAGFFGVAPGTSMATNPNAMKTIERNTIFTNVAETSDGGFYWEGLEDQISDDTECIDWLGNKWNRSMNTKAAHPNSRFCTPSSQCPIMDPDWESTTGVPIDAILFGGRRPITVPLVYESFSWQHGIFVGASMRSEATAAAEHKGKEVMNDPFAMRPFLGYNFGRYLDHWLSMQDKPNAKMPKIFHVNWFRKRDNEFLWPGFGENSRVLEWIFRRTDGEDIAEARPIGYVPKPNSINTDGLQGVDMEELMSTPRDEWLQETIDVEKYFNEQVADDLPVFIKQELDNLRVRLH